MGIYFEFKELVNLLANEDLLKSKDLTISINELSETGLVIELNSPNPNLGSSLQLNFTVKSPNESILMPVICSVIKIENHENSSRVELHLTQFNKKDWHQLLKLLSDKQESLSTLLKILRS